MLIQGAGLRRKSIREKNQLLPGRAAAIDTRGRGATHCSSPGALPQSNSGGRAGRWGEDETQTP